MSFQPALRISTDSDDIILVPLEESGFPPNAMPLGTILGQSSDPWLVIAPASALLHPSFAEIFMRASVSRRDVGIFYADEVEHVATGFPRLLLKPSINHSLLISDDYIGFPVIVRKSVFDRLGGFRRDAGTAAVYDLLLRALGEGVGIERIAEVLVAHNGARCRPWIEHRRAAVMRSLGHSNRIFEILAGLTEQTLQLRRRFDEFPEVTLVVPTCQSKQTHVRDATYNKPYIINFLESLQRTDWPIDRFEVLIGDDVADDGIYSDIEYNFNVRRIITERARDEPFNYAAKMNRLWREARTEDIVLMNDDVVVREPEWLRALMTFSMSEDVGGVGARLLYGDGCLQHAGVPGGMFGACVHAWIFQPAAAATYDDWALKHREWSMVTGAVFATRRSILESLNGFDERFNLEFNDIDLCLRMKLLGYKIIYTPFAELTHYEKSSRGEAWPEGGQVALFLKRWTEFLDNDPAFHPGFDLWNSNLTPRPVSHEWYSELVLSGKR